MAAAADRPWPAMARQAWRDLLPFPGRFGLAWRVALLCALVAAVAMLYKVPEAAIGCYLVIFIARPDGAECIGQGIGLIILAGVVVLAMAPLIAATADNPMLRIAILALLSFVFVFLGAASQLGEIGSIIGLVIAFVLTLVDQLPAGEIATRGLLYAWQMAAMPMALMIVFNIVLGTPPHRLLRRTVAERLLAAADALALSPAAAPGRLAAPLAEGIGADGQKVMLARLFHTAPSAEVTWLSGAARTSYQLLLAVAALPAGMAEGTRAHLADHCRKAAGHVSAGRRPEAPQTDAAPESETPVDPTPVSAAQAAVTAALAGLARADGGTRAVAPKPPFLAVDAFTNPDYQRYALKTTAAAIICYLTYSLIGWQGIHTAMITCYVAALGTTAETVHKLALRISGCLLGAGLGFFSILFVIPHLESVGGLMVLVFLGILPAAWISSGNERISYAGVQVGLAFLLTILNGFAPSLDMSAGRDRIVGILLGNLVVYLIFTGIWPKSAVLDVRARLSRALDALARLAAREPAERALAMDDASLVETEAEKARQQLLLLPFEPALQRPTRMRIARLDALIADVRAALPVLLFAGAPSPEITAHFARAAEEVAQGSGGDLPDMSEADGDPGVLAALVRRIERLAAG
ncbi:FUSC family protein [Xanthobacter sp. 126]|uniref:FUSC family protein n=1 Tax=Xanthobacter sp. 126 TaxID=1131814 RepID=UPI00045E69EC|nr:FUSC family protein [Xanthobacter sp. 126]